MVSLADFDINTIIIEFHSIEVLQKNNKIRHNKTGYLRERGSFNSNKTFAHYVVYKLLHDGCDPRPKLF